MRTLGSARTGWHGRGASTSGTWTISLEYTQFRFAILLQRAINNVYASVYANGFSYSLYGWQAISLLGFITCLFMKPFRMWILFSLFTFSKIMVPAMVSWSQLRLALPGLFLFYVLAMVFCRQMISHVSSWIIESAQEKCKQRAICN